MVIEQRTAYGLGIRTPDYLKFPDVLLCDVNPNNHSEQLRLGIPMRLTPTMDIFSKAWNLTNLAQYRMWDFENFTKDLEILDKIQAKNNMSFAELIWAKGHRCTDFLKYCSRGSKSDTGTMSQKPCCEDARRVIYNNFGVCYLMPGRNQSRSEGVYANFGALLNVMAKINSEFYYPSAVRVEGIFVGIAHDLATEFDSEFLTALPGTMTLIDLMPKKTIQLNTKREKCKEDTLENVQLCYKKCEITFFSTRCGCVPIAFAHINTTDSVDNPSCGARQIVQCLREHEDVLTTVEACRKKCVPPCSKWTYDSSVSKIPYWVDKENASRHEKIWLEIANINIFFNSLDYQEVSQFFTMTKESLFGSIGGLFGIYLGGSLLAILHCLFSMVEVWKGRSVNSWSDEHSQEPELSETRDGLLGVPTNITKSKSDDHITKPDRAGKIHAGSMKARIRRHDDI